MARTFSTHVVVSHNGEIKTFGPGQPVPEWANPGEHVLEPLKGETVEETPEDLLGEPTVDEVIAEEQGPAGDVVDFTAPAPAKRGPGRPRKN